MLRDVTSTQRRTLIAAALGWALDAFDVMLYAMVVAYVMRDLRIDKATVGLLNTLTLLASGMGGILFGWLADRIGRTRALMLSIATYSVCSFASGLSTSVQMLAASRFVLGLGMGGEWNTGATLVAETWPTHLRAKAIAVMQSSWAWGFAAAALAAGLVMEHFHNWRYVFFLGIAPALLVLWIRSEVPESEMWREHVQAKTSATKFSREHLRNVVVLLILNCFGLFAWWGLFTWIPPYLSLPVEQGGRGFSQMGTTGLLVFLNLAGMFPGYITFGFVADRLGRRWAFFVYLFTSAVVVPIYAAARQPWQILVMGAVVAFFGTGFFAGSGIVGSELFPTHVRARALGVSYSGARMVSSVAPYVIGALSLHQGLSGAFVVCAVAFLLASGMALLLPETRGRELAS